MTTNTYTCDRCSNIIVRDRTLLLVESGPLAGRRGELDLCPGCCEALMSWLAAPALAHPPAGARMAKVG